MGTTCTVKFYRENREELILSAFRQSDGGLEYVGSYLADFLKEKKMTNKDSGKFVEDGYAIGMGCLAAQFIVEMKSELLGVFYMTDANDLREYNYEVRFINDEFIIKVNDFFEGTLDEFIKLIPNE